MKLRSINSNSGFVLITTLFMMSLLLSLVAAYSVMSHIELATNKRSVYSSIGFYAAEAGLNLRAEQIRATFVDYNRPAGTSPTPTNPCTGANQGSGDFACQTFPLGNHESVTYVEEDPTNPLILTVPPGELYQNLNAQEYRYTVTSSAVGPDDEIEAILELRFKSRLVPLFQFVAFYDKDLEILPGPTMNLSGPVHTNGDLYLSAGNQLNISGQVSTAGSLFRGRKNDSSCSGTVRVADPLNLLNLVSPCGSRVLVTEPDVASFNGMVEMNVTDVTVPAPEELDPTSASVYYSKADLRLALKLDAANNLDTSSATLGVEVRDSSGNVKAAETNSLNNSCNFGAVGESSSGANDGKTVGYSTSFHNNRENKDIRMFEVDLRGLFDCIHQQNLMGVGKGLDDDSEGGLVFHFTVDGPDSASNANSYGVRIRNAGELQAQVAAPSIQGITIVSDQAAYTHGDYNATNWIPAAILADAFNPLSNNWNLNDAASHNSNTNSRVASNTTFMAAILAGTNTTGGIDGVGGQGGAYNGGLENYPRFHEKWSGRTFLYRGSFVSLNESRHSNGAWKYGNPQYQAPNRDWDYDTRFNDAANLPPLTPRFVYLRQQLFSRDYDRS